MIKVGILGAAGYTGGELIRLLINHPQAEIVFANSESNAGNLVSDVHEGLLGETELRFTDEMPFDQVDVVFFCFGHGKSATFLKEHTIPENVKIIDLAQDFRIKGDHDYIYGLPETHKDLIADCQHLANPGCFATCIQLAMLPALKAGIISGDIHVNGITGSTGAGQKPGATTISRGATTTFLSIRPSPISTCWRLTRRCRSCAQVMTDAYCSSLSEAVSQGASS